MRMATPPRTAVAFAPAHVTGLFAPRLSARDPRARGSVGAGIVLDVGVTARARLESSSRPSVQLGSDVGSDLPISLDVARRLLRERPVHLVVKLRHDLPVGQGFGMSAAGALATAQAAGRVLGIPPRESIAVAHLADLFGRGGLGGVAAILGGGFEIRRRPGIPPWGSVEHARFPYPVVVGWTGAPLPSPSLLGDEALRARASRAAAAGLRRLLRAPTADRLLTESERFTDAMDLEDDRLRRVIVRLRAPDVRVGQAMFGRSFFAVGLTPAAHRRVRAAVAALGLESVTTRVSRRGAFVAPPSSKLF
jgi:pantoate kinase